MTPRSIVTLSVSHRALGLQILATVAAATRDVSVSDERGVPTAKLVAACADAPAVRGR